MVFETLYEAAQRGELILIYGGVCRYHIRRDCQLTIYEIISTRRGAGYEMLGILKQMSGVHSLFAKCPVDLSANEWYERQGFDLESVEITRTGRGLNCWRLQL